MRSLYKSFSTLTISILCILIPANGFAVERLEMLITEALNNNPHIKEAYNRWKAEQYRVTPSRSLPDPAASYSFFGESIETRVGPQRHKIGASQKIPFPSKLTYRGRAREKSAEIFKQEFEAAKREVIKDVKITYYDIFWVEKAIQVIKSEKAILENLEKVAKRKYETNLTHQQDVIKAHVEITKLINKLFDLHEHRKGLVAKMISLLNRERTALFGGVDNVSQRGFKYTLLELKEMSMESRQELKGANLAIDKARHEKSLAKLSYLPDFTFGFDYTVIGKGSTTLPNDGKDAWRGIVVMNIPIWFHKNRAKVREKKAAMEANKQDYENTKNAVVYEVEDFYFKLKAYRDIVHLHKTALIPQTEQAFDTSKVAYEAGKTDFLNWLDSERTILQTRLAYYKALSNYLKTIARLERAVGRDL